MKKTIALFLGILAAVSLLTSCEEKQPADCQPEFYANATGLVVNEQGEPIPNIVFYYDETRWTDTLRYRTYEEYNKVFPNTQFYFRTDENGRFSFQIFDLNYTSKPRTKYLLACFFDIDGDENGSYETLYIESEPIRAELTWTGEEWLGIGASTNLFEPVDLGTFVMHEKK